MPRKPIADARRCKAKTSSSGYKERCKKPAIKGGTVCQTHGGGAPQVKRSARERLDRMVDPVLDIFETALKKAKGSEHMAFHPQVIKVSKLILDRAGYPAVSKIELSDRDKELTEAQKQTIVTAMSNYLELLSDAYGFDSTHEWNRSAAREALVSASEGRTPEPPPGRPAKLVTGEVLEPEKPNSSMKHGCGLCERLGRGCHHHPDGE